ncbi:ABC-three component system protein [Bacillus thuringiensis]|uniref:ABC-three component system protein n=1 Tax=Bacillus thuringiensis TaxID=1428 RepID=UPI000BFD4B7B|nr:ABC-three component system protein [Bacillus thuringiensis]PGN29272.1 hypothetical protein CN969_00105 [Bacillus thuringiensis]
MKSTERVDQGQVNEFDATHSWNGFSYQGKIGLIVVLDSIIELVSSQKNIKDYHIEFEWLEDFSIKKKQEYLTIHQVKSYGEESLASYKDAIWLLLGKVINEDLRGIQTAYLHVAENIKHKSNVITSIVDLRKKFEELQPPPEKKEEKKEEKEKVNKVKKTNEVNKKNVISAREHYERVINANKKQEALSKLKLYTYTNDKYFCKLSDVENTVREKIEEYYKVIGKHEKITSNGLMPNYIKGTYNCLLKIIDDYVNNRHQDRQKHAGEIKTISFKEFQDILDQEYEKLPKEYYVSFFREKVLKIVKDDIELKKKVIEKIREKRNAKSEALVRKHEVINDLLIELSEHIHKKFSDEQFLQLLYKISPHKLVNLDGEYMGLSLTELLENIGNPWVTSLRVILFKEFENESVLLNRETFIGNITQKLYLLTTISINLDIKDEFDEIEWETKAEEIGISIYNNNKLNKELFEIDYFVTKDIEGISIEECIENNVVKINESLEKNNILQIKNAKFIKKESLEKG